jgi:F-type H+-transporting ATPase subunit b
VINLDSTIFIQVVNFLVLMATLNVLLYKPILSIIEKRKKILLDADEEIKRLNATVEQKALEYEEKLRQAKQNAVGVKSDILKSAADQAKAIVDEKRSKIPAMMAEFQDRVSKEVESARQILKNQSQRISAEIAEKVLGRSLQ